MNGEPAATADGQPKRLDPRTITVERLQGAIASAILSVIALVVVLGFAFSGAFDTLWAMVALGSWALFVAGLTTLSLAWPAVRYRHVGYTVSTEGIEIRRGVLWRSVVSVPRNRVQHTDVSSGLIERTFELATLVIYTAGTQHASVELSGLSHTTAVAIRDHLIEGGGGDGV